MQKKNVKWDMKKWGNIGLTFSFFLILLGVIAILVNASTTYTISVISVGFGAFFASIVMRAERRMPTLRFASGICLAAAIFSQAIAIKNQYFAMVLYVITVVWLILLTVDIYKKHLK